MDWSSLGRCVVAAESTIVIAWLCLHGLRGLRKQSASVLAVLVLLGVGTALDAQKTNGVNNLPPMPLPPRLVPVAATVAEDDVARGWRVESVTTNETLSYTMPSNAVYVSNWHIHGARSSFGNNVVNLGGTSASDWAFPLGTNGAAFSSFWYFVDGRIRPKPKDIIRKYNVTTNDVLGDLRSLSAKYSLSETNDEKRLAREMAFMWIGHYGGTNDLAQLETVMTNNADYAQESALFATGDKTSSISRRRLRTASPARKYGII